MDKPIHIFRAGKWKDSRGRIATIDEKTLQDIANAYNPDLFDAPVVVGHPLSNKPAYGWVRRLEVKDGNLFAELHKLDDQFREMVKEERYKKVSASFYAPESANNPLKGKWYLKHVGFLGAVAPAVQGLQVAQFSDLSEDEFCFEQAVSDLKRQLFDERLQKLTARERSLWIRAQLDAGRILPAEESFVTAFMQTLDEDDYSFADPGSGTGPLSQLDAFKSLLEKRPAMVSFSEMTAPTQKGILTPEDHSFSAPRGYEASEDGIELHNKAMTYAKEADISYSEAVIELHAKAQAYAREHDMPVAEALTLLCKT